MGKQIDDLVLLAILQNQIKNAVDENKVDISKFATVKHVNATFGLTQEQKEDITKNLYDFLIEDSTHSVYRLISDYSSYWKYVNFTEFFEGHVLTPDGHIYTKLRVDKEVRTDTTGAVTSTDASIETYSLPKPQNFILKSDQYPDVVFYANYFNDSTDSVIYRFSSGIILDSSSETPQYKIVFASYNVNEAKVTFVEKVLT